LNISRQHRTLKQSKTPEKDDIRSHRQDKQQGEECADNYKYGTLGKSHVSFAHLLNKSTKYKYIYNPASTHSRHSNTGPLTTPDKNRRKYAINMLISQQKKTILNWHQHSGYNHDMTHLRDGQWPSFFEFTVLQTS